MGEAKIPEDLQEDYENAQIGSANYGNSVTGAEYRRRMKLIERIAALEQQLAANKIRIEQQNRVIGAYQSSGACDADAMAEKYLDAIEQLAERDSTIARLKKVEQKYVNLLAENIIEFSESDPELWGTFQNENADLLKRLRNTLLAARAKETEC